MVKSYLDQHGLCEKKHFVSVIPSPKRFVVDSEFPIPFTVHRIGIAISE